VLFHKKGGEKLKLWNRIKNVFNSESENREVNLSDVKGMTELFGEAATTKSSVNVTEENSLTNISH